MIVGYDQKFATLHIALTPAKFMYRAASRFQRSSPYLDDRKSEEQGGMRKAAADRIIDMMAIAQFILKIKEYCKAIFPTIYENSSLNVILQKVIATETLASIPESVLAEIRVTSSRSLDKFLGKSANEYSRYIRTRDRAFALMQAAHQIAKGNPEHLSTTDIDGLNPIPLYTATYIEIVSVAKKYGFRCPPRRLG